MKIKYNEPIMEVIILHNLDVIRTSDDGGSLPDIGTGGSGSGGNVDYGTNSTSVDF